MRLLVPLILLTFSCAAFANSQILFSKDGSKATITLLAFTTNPDAVSLDRAMAAAAQDIMGKLVKRIDFATDDGAPSLDLQCVFSKISPDTGSCVLVLHASTNLLMEPARSHVRYELTGTEAARLAAQFVPPANGTEVYRSSDNLLVLQLMRNRDTGIPSFLLTYGQ